MAGRRAVKEQCCGIEAGERESPDGRVKLCADSTTAGSYRKEVRAEW